MAPSNLELQTQVPSENLLLVPSASQGLGEDVLKIEEVEVEVEVKVLVEVLKVLKEIVEAFGEIVEEDKDPFEVEDRIGNILEVDKDPFGVGVPEPMSKYEDGVGDMGGGTLNLDTITILGYPKPYLAVSPAYSFHMRFHTGFRIRFEEPIHAAAVHGG